MGRLVLSRYRRFSSSTPRKGHRKLNAAFFLALLLASLLATRNAQGSGSGDFSGLRNVYRYGVVPIGIVVPEYSLRIDSNGARSGLQWELPVLFSKKKMTAPVWGGGASISYYPGAKDVMLRATARALFPIREASYETEVTGILFGLGAFLHQRSYGPRLELRLRHWCWAGLFLSAAWEPRIAPEFSHGGEASAGIEFPFQ